MNLNELRDAMSSEATKENAELKKKLTASEMEHKSQIRKLEEELKVLSEDCKALTNRCFVLTRGSMCMFCELHGYRCDRAMSYSEKIEATKNLMEVVTNAEN